MVAEVWEGLGGGGLWNPIFGRLFNDWGIDDTQNLLNLLNCRKVISGYERQLILEGGKKWAVLC